MKQLLLSAFLVLSATTFAQDVKTTEQTVGFSNGSHNAIVVTIPHGNREIIEKELKSEMKDWGGKYNSSKDEYTAMQGSIKAMGDKTFDGYAKIIESNGEFQVAFAVDLGGAYMDSKAHNAQFKVIQDRVKKFAKKASSESVKEELAIEAKLLKELEKNKAELEKSIENSKKDIEDYKKKIESAESKIKSDESDLSKKEGELAAQAKKIAEVENKLKGLK